MRSFRLFGDEPLSKSFCRKTLEDVVEENVQYVESRGFYLDDEDIIGEIQRDYPEFDVKYISASGRSSTREGITKALELAPFFAGLCVTKSSNSAGYAWSSG